METNFDKIVNRRGTGSVKWDSRPDVLPLWVADMDFETAPCILEALRRRAEPGVFGYTLVRDDYYEALIDWFSSRHLYEFKREDVIYTSGVVPALSAIIKGLTKPGDGVIVQTPVYNCFFSSIRNNGCRVVENPFIREDISDTKFTYHINFEELEHLAADPSNTMLILCNPHNPVGRVWTREELERIHEICVSNGVEVVSDEIHCELTMPGFRYTPYGTVDHDAVVCVSPSKAFNIAGLQIANIISPDSSKRALIDRAININEVCDVNPFGVEALIAAYSPEGAEWLEYLRGYLYENYIFMQQFMAEKLPQCPVTRLEATYLPWVDVRALGISADRLTEILMQDAHVWVNSGIMYGYIRLNIACPRSLLEEGLEKIAEQLRALLPENN